MKNKIALVAFILSVLYIQIICSQSDHTKDKPGHFVSNTWQFEEARQFDFWIGKWDVNLRKQEADATWVDWKKSKANIHSILDGRAILELWEEQSEYAPSQTIIGYSLRYFDTDLKEWVIWLNWPGMNRSGSTSLSGKFRHHRGQFFGSRPLNDSTDLISRYTFSDITPTSLRWDDAFSKDGGKTWSANWLMEFTRTASAPKKFSGKTIHTYRSGERCTRDEFGVLNQFVGKWGGKIAMKGHNRDGKEIRMDNYWALGGCSVMSFMEIENDAENIYKEFALHTFNTFANMYEVGVLNNTLSSKYIAYYGNYSENKQLVLNSLNQQDRSLKETYAWTFLEIDRIRIEKWTYKNGEKVKVLDGELNRLTTN